MKPKVNLTNLNLELMPRVASIQEKMQKLQERFDLKMENFEFKEISEKDLEKFEDQNQLSKTLISQYDKFFN